MIEDPSEYLDKNKWRTFREWSDGGYLIIKGSKGTKVNGQYLFSIEQVCLKPKQPPCPEEPDEDWDDPRHDDSWWDPWGE